MKKILPSLILIIVSGLLILFILFPPNLPPSVPNYVDGNVFCERHIFNHRLSRPNTGLGSISLLRLIYKNRIIFSESLGPQTCLWSRQIRQ